MNMDSRRVTNGKRTAEQKKKDFYVFNKTCNRWRRMLETVGLIGLLLSDLIPLSTMKELSNADFDRFLSELALHILLFDKHWPRAPLNVQSMESKSFSILLLIHNSGCKLARRTSA
jgi:hypothetical protein